MTHTPHWSVQRQAADCLGVSERTLHRWRSAGQLKARQSYEQQSGLASYSLGAAFWEVRASKS